MVNQGCRTRRGNSDQSATKEKSNREIIEATFLCNLLKEYTFKEGADHREWGDGNNNFSSKVEMDALISRRRLREQLGLNNFLDKTIWHVRYVLPKVRFFT